MKRAVKYAILLCLLCAGQSNLMAQYGQEYTPPDMGPRGESSERPQKKTPGWVFNRPAMDSAAAQIQYARSLLDKGRTRAAMNEYVALVHEWADSPEAPVAQFEYAKLLEERGKYKRAFDEFQYLIDFYVGQFPYEEVLEHQFKIANYMMTTKQAKWFFGGIVALDRALPMFQKIVENGPNWGKAAEAEFYIGVINEDIKEYEAANLAYETVQRRYRGSDLAVDASFRRACCLYRSSKFTPRDEKGYRDAMSALSMFIRDYPSSKDMKTARLYLDELKETVASMYYERADYYDRIAKKPGAAIIAYNDLIRNFPASDKAQKATDRIEVLRAQMEKKNEP
jgi:TolA-binding protein